MRPENYAHAREIRNAILRAIHEVKRSFRWPSAISLNYDIFMLLLAAEDGCSHPVMEVDQTARGDDGAEWTCYGYLVRVDQYGAPFGVEAGG